MFRDELQAAMALTMLCRRAGIESHEDEMRGELLWTERGPTCRARAMLEQWIPLDEPDRTILKAASALWNGRHRPPASDLMQLRDERRVDVMSLITAEREGPGAVDRWIGERRKEVGAAPTR
ncbi:MAG: hypothetical protein AAF533_20275 [Acidobacteriota bacterium]